MIFTTKVLLILQLMSSDGGAHIHTIEIGSNNDEEVKKVLLQECNKIGKNWLQMKKSRGTTADYSCETINYTKNILEKMK